MLFIYFNIKILVLLLRASFIYYDIIIIVALEVEYDSNNDDF